MENEKQCCSNLLDKGLLVLRIGIGIIFLSHGVPKLIAGSQMWEQLGMAMGNIGIHFAPVFWGFMAAIAESLGGLLLIFGRGIRITASFMLFDMLIAIIMHYKTGGGFSAASHAITLGIVLISLIISGPGIYVIGCCCCKDNCCNTK
jgi:putative oxidoreductase